MTESTRFSRFCYRATVAITVGLIALSFFSRLVRSLAASNPSSFDVYLEFSGLVLPMFILAALLLRSGAACWLAGAYFVIYAWYLLAFERKEDIWVAPIDPTLSILVLLLYFVGPFIFALFLLRILLKHGELRRP
jgi:hypothetical protein